MRLDAAGEAAHRAWPRGFHVLIATQFFSALADNALLIVTIAWLAREGMPGWWAPLLKVGFTLSYVLLAPVVGAVADSVPKGRLMAWMNGVKIAGTAALLLGLHPVLACAVVGLGAAAYAPAKYGLVTELVQPARLVAANAWLEVSVVCAVLLGTALGGFLVSAGWLGYAGGLEASVMALAAVYLLASCLNRGVPDSGVRYPSAPFRPLDMIRNFKACNRLLWNDRDGGLSLAVTTLLWGVGATLQFAVLRWSVERLGLSLDRAAYLQAAVVVGVVVGAGAAGRWVSLTRAKKVLGAGLVLGLLLPVAAQAHDVVHAAVLLAAAGGVAGFLVVPLNALLQHRGFELLSAGRSIAVQGFNENAGVLVMLGVYALLLAWEVPVVALMSGLGMVVAICTAGALWREARAH